MIARVRARAFIAYSADHDDQWRLWHVHLAHLYPHMRANHAKTMGTIWPFWFKSLQRKTKLALHKKKNNSSALLRRRNVATIYIYAEHERLLLLE